MYISMQEASSALHDTHASYDFFFVDRTILPLYCEIVPKLANSSYQILTSSPRKFLGFDFTPPPFASVAPTLLTIIRKSALRNLGQSYKPFTSARRLFSPIPKDRPNDQIAVPYSSLQPSRFISEALRPIARVGFLHCSSGTVPSAQELH